MPDDALPPTVAAVENDFLHAPGRTRLLVSSVVRMVVAVAVLLGLYFFVPLDETLVGGTVIVLATLVIGLFVFVFAHQVRRILRASHPVLQAAESLVILTFMFIVLFAAIYVTLSASEPAAFDTPMSKVDGLYFTVVTLGTVGYGDIHATNDLAELLVTIQILLDLALAGIAIKVLSGAAKVGLKRQSQAADPAGPPAGP